MCREVITTTATNETIRERLSWLWGPMFRVMCGPFRACQNTAGIQLTCSTCPVKGGFHVGSAIVACACSRQAEVEVSRSFQCFGLPFICRSSEIVHDQCLATLALLTKHNYALVVEAHPSTTDGGVIKASIKCES
jgi:hypothetical protein